MIPRGWLPPGKRAALCFSIDDVHPSKSTDAYEAGGDLERGALGQVAWLLERHSKLRVTLFTTPDWREISAHPTSLLRHVPVVRDLVFLTKTLPRGTMRVDRHPAFVRYLRALSRAEVGLHGLHHIHRGLNVPVEFQRQSVDACRRMLSEGMQIFESAGLPYVRGLAPPGWNAPAELLEAAADLGLRFVASARDIRTPIGRDATAAMSGLRGVSLVFPELVARGRVVHVTSNFQATTPIDRALDILEIGGIVAIKAHIIKDALGHVALDGMDALYRNYLDVVLTEIERRYGDELWWTSMNEIAERVLTPEC